MTSPRGYVRPRDGKLELVLILGGRRMRKATEYVAGQEAEAEAFLAEVLRELQATAAAPAASPGDLTLREWGEQWIAERKARKVISVADEESQLRYHVLPALGSFPLRSLTKAQMLAWVRSLPGRKRLDTGEPISSRYVHHIAGTVRRLLGEAVDVDLLPVSPCTWKAKRDLPKKRDVNPGKRSAGGFEGWEVHELVTNAEIPWDRRVLWAVSFLTGMRPGEVSARRWRDVTFADPTHAEVLGRIEACTAWNSRIHVEKVTKTDVVKVPPIHPMLDAILRAWRDEGWTWYVGRKPEPEDLLIPSAKGKMRNVSQTNKSFQTDVAKLGLREGRTAYETRSTFRSLAQAGGASIAELNLITHPSPRDAAGLYNRLNAIWPALCRAVLAVRIEPREPVNPGADHRSERAKPCHGNEERENPRGFEASGVFGERAVQDSNLWPSAPEADALSS